jgi:hypothetical protein
MSDIEQDIANIAWELGKQNARDILAHEDLCAFRYGQIEKSMSSVEAVLKWFAVTMVTVLLSVLAWSITHQYEASEVLLESSKLKIELLEKQIQLQNNTPATSGEGQ